MADKSRFVIVTYQNSSRALACSHNAGFAFWIGHSWQDDHQLYNAG